MRYITAIPYLPLYNESIYPMPKSNAERQRDYQRRAAEALRNARTATLPPTPAPEHRLPTLLLTAYELAGGAYDYGDEVEDSPLPDHAPTVARLIYDILASAGFEPIDPDDANSNRNSCSATHTPKQSSIYVVAKAMHGRSLSMKATCELGRTYPRGRGTASRRLLCLRCLPLPNGAAHPAARSLPCQQ